MMTPNPFLGVFFHWLGGLASGSFYVPYRMVKKWAWEVYWLVGGFFSWIIAPWVLAFINTNDLPAVLREAPGSAIGWAYFWGAMWGLGGLTFGLTMRYLGMSLGMAVALSYCSAFGTLMPPLFEGTLLEKFATESGHWILFGIIVCLIGIVVTGWAGMSKDKEMPEEKKKEVIKEFNFWKGIGVATFSGIMSASFAYGLAAAEPIATLSAAHGTSTLWTGLPKLCVVLLGGFTSNFIWCVLLNIKNRTGSQYFCAKIQTESPKREDETIIETAIDAPSEEVVEHMPVGKNERRRASADAEQLLLQRAGGRNLVPAVLLLHDGRNPDGQLQVLQLDAAHGQHHHLQLAVGNRPAGVERQQPRHQEKAGIGTGPADPFDGHRRLRQLPRHAPGGEIRIGIS